MTLRRFFPHIIFLFISILILVGLYLFNSIYLFDVHIALMFFLMYVVFYTTDLFLEHRFNSKKLLGKDLIWLVLKFLIPLFFLVFRSVWVEEQYKKIFFIHFLIVALLYFTMDFIIYYFFVIQYKSKEDNAK